MVMACTGVVMDDGKCEGKQFVMKAGTGGMAVGVKGRTTWMRVC